MRVCPSVRPSVGMYKALPLLSLLGATYGRASGLVILNFSHKRLIIAVKSVLVFSSRSLKQVNDWVEWPKLMAIHAPPIFFFFFLSKIEFAATMNGRPLRTLSGENQSETKFGILYI